LPPAAFCSKHYKFYGGDDRPAGRLFFTFIWLMLIAKIKAATHAALRGMNGLRATTVLRATFAESYILDEL